MRHRLNNFWVLLLLFIPMLALGQDLYIQDQLSIGGRLNLVIAADTAGAGAVAWQAGTRVYVLQRDGVYPVDAQFQLGNNRKLKIRCAYPGEHPAAVDDKYDPMIFTYDAVPGTTGRPPGTIFILGGTNNEVNLKHVLISGFNEDQPGKVDGVQGNLINIIAAGGDGNGRIIIDSCVLKSSNGNHIRTDGTPSTVRVTNTLFADMGNLATSNLGAGEGINVRANQVDTLDVRNCTFVNYQDRLIRHYLSTGPIKNLWFNNNTIINGLSFHGMLSLGDVDNTGAGVLQIKNNLLIDNFALGADTGAIRQYEFNDSGEMDTVDGGPRMTWIIAKPNSVAHWDIANNYYAVSDSGRVMFNMPQPKAPYYRSEGPALTWGINKRLQQVGGDSLTAFRRIGITPVNVPDLMTRMIRWFYRPYAEGGAGRRKLSYDPNYPQIGPGNWTYDYNRKGWGYYTDTLNCSFSASVFLSGIGDPRWHQNGVFTNTLTVNATNGSVVKYPDDAAYNTGSAVKLTATPAVGFHFVNWSGAVTGTTNPATVMMTSSKAVTAKFAPDTMTISVPVYTGWNLVSVPLIQSNYTPSAIFLGVFGDMFGYDPTAESYVVKSNLTIGYGYFAYFTSSKTVDIKGAPVALPITVVCKAGWNLIGSREVPVPIPGGIIVSAGEIFGDIFVFDSSGGGYLPTPVLIPGRGAWVYVTRDCVLTF
jgi:hypothetical protein